MAEKKSQPVDWETMFSGISYGKTVKEYSANRHIFRQGDPADSIFFLRSGRVKLTVISNQGKEAIVAIMNAGEFFGEGCLAGQLLRMATASATTDCSIIRLEKQKLSSLLHDQHAISEVFVSHLLSRNIRYEADLVDQLFNSSEKRLARILLLLSHLGKESRSEPVLPKVSQNDLAEMVGTTRSRVSHFMNRFREHGFIEALLKLSWHTLLCHSELLHAREPAVLRYCLGTGCHSLPQTLSREVPRSGGHYERSIRRRHTR